MSTAPWFVRPERPPSLLAVTLLAGSLVALPGCSSFDDDVFPQVVDASLKADRARPDALAAIGVTLRIVAGRNADRAVALGRVELWSTAQPAARAAALDLAFPDGDAIQLHQGQAMTVDLVNVGTKNADLIPLCGATFYLTVFLAYPEDPSGATGTGTGGGTPQVTVVCD